MKKLAWAAIVLLLAAPASAQMAKGDRVRLEVDPVGKIDGQLVASDDSSVTVLSRTSTLQIERGKIERAQRYQGEHRNWGRGLLVGAGVGLTFALLADIVAHEEGDEGVGALYLSFAILGAAPGTLIGGLIKTDQWKTVPVENLTVSTRVDRAYQVQLVLSASF